MLGALVNDVNMVEGKGVDAYVVSVAATILARIA